MSHQEITIHQQPDTGINPELAAQLVGVTVSIPPELLVWTTEPTDPAQSGFYFVRNDDLRAALMAKLGAKAADGLYGLLPIGRTTKIPRCACTLTTTV